MFLRKKISSRLEGQEKARSKFCIKKFSSKQYEKTFSKPQLIEEKEILATRNFQLKKNRLSKINYERTIKHTLFYYRSTFPRLWATSKYGEKGGSRGHIDIRLLAISESLSSSRPLLAKVPKIK